MIVSIQLECRDYYNSLAHTFSGTLLLCCQLADNKLIDTMFFRALMLPPLPFTRL